MGRSREAATHYRTLNTLAYRSATVDKTASRASLDRDKSQRLYGEFVPVYERPTGR